MSLLTQASLVVTPNGYKEGTLYSVVPNNSNGDFSVTRATTATRVNAAGLVELVPYNLLTYSEMFADASWFKEYVSSAANQTTAPNGTLTADSFSNDNTSNFHRYYQGPIANLGQPQTISFSVYLKYKDHQYTSFGITDDNFYRSQVVVDLVNGTITQNYKQNSGDTLTSTITNVGNGWYRVTGTFTYATALDGGNAYFLGMLLNQSTFTAAPYLGSGTGIYIWGAQLVEGTSALDYQATETRLNIPRLDYSNGSCPNILLEPQRTNVLKYSQDYSNVIWTKAGITATLGTQINPQGIASTYNIANTTLGDSYLEQQGLPITSGTYTTSVFIKNIDNLATTQLVAVHIAEGSITSELLYTWATNTFVLTGTNAISGKVTPYANGWIRLSFTYSIGALTTLHWSRLYANSTLSVTKSALVYGFQTELGSYSTSYIPTTSASVTRNADVLTRAGFGNTSTSGTLFFDFYAEKIESPNGQYILNLFEGSVVDPSYPVYSSPNGLSIITNGGTIDIRNNGYTQQVQTLTPTTGQRVKIAVRYNGTNVSSAINGTLSSVFADTAVGVKNALRINNGENSTHAFNAVAFFPSYLTDGEMSMLTSGVYTPALAYAQLGLVSESPACLDSSVNALL
jgi:hypothetical protein